MKMLKLIRFLLLLFFINNALLAQGKLSLELAQNLHSETPNVFKKLDKNYFLIPFDDTNYYFVKANVSQTSPELLERLTLELKFNNLKIVRICELDSAGNEVFSLNKEAYQENLNGLIELEGTKDQNFLIVLQSYGDMVAVKINLKKSEEILHFYKYQSWGKSMLYGMALLILILNLGMLIFTKRLIALYLLLFYILAFLFEFIQDGYGAYYFSFVKWGNTQQLYALALNLAFAGHIMFVKYYFNYKERFPLVNTFFSSMILVALFMGMGILFKFHIKWIYLSCFYIPLLSISSALFGALVLKKRSTEHQLFIASYSILLVCYFLFNLDRYHLIGDAWYFNHLFLVGLIFHALMFTYLFVNDMFRKIRKHELIAVHRLTRLNNLSEKHKKQLEIKVQNRTLMYETLVGELTAAKSEILHSIDYARKIQRARLQSESDLKAINPNTFVVYHPQNRVSGDFYMVKKLFDHHIVAVVGDGTGHGVPGGFMSFIGLNLTEKYIPSVLKKGTAKTLQKMNEDLHERLNYDKSKMIHIRDGFDIGLLLIDLKNKSFEYCGAKINLNLVNENQLMTLKGARISLGSDESELEDWNVEKGVFYDKTNFYMCTDGVKDQFGARIKEKFKSTRLKDMLLKLQSLSHENQKAQIEKTIDDWRGNEEQIDDICILGINIKNEDI